MVGDVGVVTLQERAYVPRIRCMVYLDDEEMSRERSCRGPGRSLNGVPPQTLILESGIELQECTGYPLTSAVDDPAPNHNTLT